MDLKIYLKISGTTHKEFAKMIDVSEASISNYINWRRKPSSSVVARIEIATKGKVTVHDLMAYWETKKKHG